MIISTTLCHVFFLNPNSKTFNFFLIVLRREIQYKTTVSSATWPNTARKVCICNLLVNVTQERIKNLQQILAHFHKHLDIYRTLYVWEYVCPIMHFVVWRRELKPGNSVECRSWGIPKRPIKDQRSTICRNQPHGYNSWLVEMPKRIAEIMLHSTGVKLLTRNALGLLNSVKKNFWPL